jgi:hypothetical protein
LEPHALGTVERFIAPTLSVQARLFPKTLGTLQRTLACSRGSLEDVVIVIARASDVATVDSALGTRNGRRYERYSSREARQNERLETHQTLQVGRVF